MRSSFKWYRTSPQLWINPPSLRGCCLQTQMQAQLRIEMQMQMQMAQQRQAAAQSEGRSSQMLRQLRRVLCRSSRSPFGFSRARKATCTRRQRTRNGSGRRRKHAGDAARAQRTADSPSRLPFRPHAPASHISPRVTLRAANAVLHGHRYRSSPIRC